MKYYQLIKWAYPTTMIDTQWGKVTVKEQLEKELERICDPDYFIGARRADGRLAILSTRKLLWIIEKEKSQNGKRTHKNQRCIYNDADVAVYGDTKATKSSKGKRKTVYSKS